MSYFCKIRSDKFHTIAQQLPQKTGHARRAVLWTGIILINQKTAIYKIRHNIKKVITMQAEQSKK